MPAMQGMLKKGFIAVLIMPVKYRMHEDENEMRKHGKGDGLAHAGSRGHLASRELKMSRDLSMDVRCSVRVSLPRSDIPAAQSLNSCSSNRDWMFSMLEIRRQSMIAEEVISKDL